MYIGLESAASSLWNFKSHLVPGILQTADYARALVHHARPMLPVERVDRFVEARMQRQQRLTGDDPLTVRAVIGEATLHCTVDAPEVTRGQFAHLARLAELPNVEIRILPFSAMAYALHGRPVLILDFPEPGDAGLAYFEHLSRSVYVEEADQIAEHRHSFELLIGSSLSVEESARRLTHRGKK